MGKNKKNRKKKGLLNRAKLIVLLVIIVSVIIFSFFFKDRIVTNLLQHGMEKIFASEVTITKVHFKVFSSSLTIGFLAVVDSDHPGKNLFELHNIRADINTGALLKGKVWIERMEASGLASGTPSKSRHNNSKAEKDTHSANSETKTANAIKTGFSFPGFSLNPQEIIQNHMKDFSSFRTIEDSKNRLVAAGEELRAQTESLRVQVNDISSQIQNLSSTHLTSVKEGTNLLKAIKPLHTELQTVQDGSKGLASSIQKKSLLLSEEKKKIGQSLDSDYKKIDSFINTPGKTLKGAVSAYTRQLLQKETGRYYTLIMKGLNTVKNLSNNKKSKKTAGRRKGRSIQFPVKKTPLFLLQTAKLGIIRKDGQLTVSLHDFSSNPGLVNNPTSFSVVFISPDRKAHLAGIIDTLHKETTINGGLTHFSFNNTFVSGKYDASGSFLLNDTGLLTGNSTINLLSCILKNPDGDKLKAEINRMLSSTNKKTISTAFSISKTKTSIKTDTPLDTLFSRIVSKRIEETSATLKKQTKKEFDKRYDKSLSLWSSKTENYKQLIQQGETLTQKVTEARRMLADKEAEIKKKLLALSTPGAASGGAELLKKASKGIRLPSF